MLPIIPALLRTLPILEVLRIICRKEDEEGVVLEHASICDVVIGNCEVSILKFIGKNGLNKDINVEELTRMMPSLLRVVVKKSSVQVL